MDQEEEKVTTTKSLPWKTQITLRILSVITDTSRRRDGTINRSFANFFNPKASASPNIPINGVTSDDITVDPSRNLWFRLFIPTNTEPQVSLPVIVFFHGGGFAYLSADSKAYDAVCRRFARKIQAVVVSVNYRLSPEHRYPTQYEDGFDVLRFLDEEKHRGLLPENADLSRCFFAGDSAGANIAHHVAVQFSGHQSTFSKLKVIGLVSIQPYFGGEERTEAELRLTQLVTVERTDWLWKAFLPEEEEKKWGRNHPAVNVSGPQAVDISCLDSFPKTMVVVGGLDALQDWQRRYYHWLRNSGKEASIVEYPTMCHAFYVFPYLPESGNLISEVARFVSSLAHK